MKVVLAPVDCLTCATWAAVANLREVLRIKSNSRRTWARLSRHIAAILLGAIVGFAMSPTVMAMPSPHGPSRGSMSGFSMTASCAHAAYEKTGRSYPTSHRNRHMPCRCMMNCSGMMGCSATALLPVGAATTNPIVLAAVPLWRLRDPGPGIRLQPDNPPPIA